MARGWESKSVEAQIDSAEERSRRRAEPALTPEQIATTREREGIELSRVRVLDNLSTATNPKYREQLERSLEFLNAKLTKLGSDA